jgi:hypothetical protein
VSRGRRAQRFAAPPPEKEKANREILYPSSLSWQDKLCYRAIDLLARAQVLIFERLVQEPVWRSGTGEVRRIRDLHDRHLENIVRMIGRDGLDMEDRLKKALLHEWSARLARQFEQRQEQKR